MEEGRGESSKNGGNVVRCNKKGNAVDEGERNVGNLREQYEEKKKGPKTKYSISASLLRNPSLSKQSLVSH
jgi:hypothetical protein